MIFNPIKFCSCALTLAMVSVPVWSESQLPDIGSSTSRVMSVQNEQIIGDDYMRQVRQLAPVMDDPEIVAYINDLGFRLVANTPDGEGRNFYFFVIEDPTLNAFALPGGYVGVHSALMLRAESESELGGVLAHEISHVTQRHLARNMEKASDITFPTLAAIIGGLIFAAANPQAGIAVMAGAQAGAQQYMINNTRENEAEADRIGMQTMARIDLDPTGMATFFEKLEVESRYMQLPPPVLLTHPVTQQRVADARLRAGELPAKHPLPSLTFRLMQAKLRDLTQTDMQLQEKEIRLLEKTLPDDPVTLYAGALLNMRLHEYAQAQSVFTRLSHDDPRNLSYILALSDAMIAQGDSVAAEKLLDQQLLLHPDHYALIVAYSKVLMVNNKPQVARQKLLAYASSPEREPSVYQLLASAQQAAGFADEVHESQGLYLQALGDLRSALQQFEIARRSRTDDPYATTRINARIKQIEEILWERRQHH